MKYSQKKCIPCEDSTIAPFSKKQAKDHMVHIPGWSLDSKHKKITRTWLFHDFVTAMVFVNKVAKIAEREGHHPDIMVHYNKVIIEVWTHSIKGLSENDIIVAAKINTILIK